VLHTNLRSKISADGVTLLGPGQFYARWISVRKVAVGLSLREAHDAVEIGNVHGCDMLAQAARAWTTIDAIGATSSQGSWNYVARPSNAFQCRLCGTKCPFRTLEPCDIDDPVASEIARTERP
jgi:hypothetical protein